MTANREPLALYVHWPWCLAKCPYCDFNSRAADPADIPQAAYLDAIVRELHHYAQITGPRTLVSIFFGGGTPSLMTPETFHTIIETADRLWGLGSPCEITLEANPTSVETARLRAFKDAGANRVSLGIQALNDADLQALGREHTTREALDALDIAAAIFNRFSFDLIYARPDQGLLAWEGELSRALALAGDHISLYQLSIEPGTAFFRAGRMEAPQDLAADLFELTQDMTQAAGLPAYEISNHARPGGESRHNLAYWQGEDYVGVGPGAHGRITQRAGEGGASFHATYQISDPARWLQAVEQNGHGTAKTRRLSAHERAEEMVMAGLRLTAGVERARFKTLSGLDVLDILDKDALALLEDAGLMDISAARIKATNEGRMKLNAVLQSLLA